MVKNSKFGKDPGRRLRRTNFKLVKNVIFVLVADCFVSSRCLALNTAFPL